MENDTAVTLLSALANPSRLAIFRLLVEAGPAGMNVGGIGTAVGLPSATLSFHLKELRHSGLVDVRRESRTLIHSANFAAMARLVDYLTRNCCGGDPAACGLPTDSATKETA